MRRLSLTLAILVSLVDSRLRAGEGATKPPAQLRVAAVQMRSSRSLSANMASAVRRLEQCARDGVRVVVFPECALTGYFDNAYMKGLSAADLDRVERQLVDACRKNRIYAIAGMAYRQGDKLYDSAVVVDPAGRVVERYYKIKLAESWPTAGDHLSVFKIDGVPCSIIICHDERYPELVRLPVLAGARVVIYLSHDSGIKAEQKLNPYRAQIQARAVENGVYVVQANAPGNDDSTGSHGQSRIIGPDGNIVQEASIFGEETLTATLDLKQANGRLARRSLEGGPLADWWREGVKRVRIVE
jgi:predicted amidohydrolase